ncbi:hypothetical protein PTSG_06329 [Salpingoeca rosetta]|uniref:Mitochondrial cardiolipin hydrolase n=1 Tax=Salpingoeca rosetta (strain ATCC 50818 / BSB-021) TaxID=946362 RepID=F2UCL2_SALR5|nr:uncharacterized protein PTSG_06329 [Salpingoeca rosetta]EGD74319.1 hypothetical protein PTSG_06329 [Salpingoeca rosetta]|eukprot:XP_004993219.1 hypothetical protein PTSG_06329 [Salpingoeca rosetta]
MSDPSCAVTVTGTDDGVSGAVQEMERILGFKPSTDALVTAEFDIHHSSYGRIIGQRGQTLKELEHDFRCSIEVPSKQADSGSHVKAQGSKGDIEQLTQKLSQLLGEPVRVVGSEAAPVTVEKTIELHSGGDIAEALFFPEPEGSHDRFQRFLLYLKSAKRTLDICVFTITDNRITRAILHAFHTGVKVRVVTDDECSSAQGSDIHEMMQAGIPVRMDNDPAHMHHKVTAYHEEFERLWKRFA